MKKIIDWFGGSVVKDLLGGLDKLFTSKEEKIKAEGVIKEIIMQKLLYTINLLLHYLDGQYRY